jgi:hypothetical protein
MLLPRVKRNPIAFLAKAGDSSSRWRSHFPLMLLLLVFICNTSLWAAVTNIGHPPDEFSHFDYIRHLAINHTLPIYGQTTYIHRQGFQAHASVGPLYYLLGTPLQMILVNATDTQQVLALRAISILLGAVTVALAYKFGRMLAPTRPEFALAVAVLVGFNPMFTYLSAAINSDNLINLIYAALLLLLAYGLRQRQPSRGWLIGLGALLGAGLITKPSIVMGVWVSALFIVFLAWKQRPRFLPALVRYGFWVSTPAVLISGWSFLRNWKLYGNPTGVVAGSRPDVFLTRPYQNVGSVWEMILATKGGYASFVPTIFHGFWGVFDHLEIAMPARVYDLLALLLWGGLIGMAFWIGRSWRNWHDNVTRQRLILAGMGGLILVLTFAGVAYVSYRIDYQAQGRYLFAALVPLAVAIVGGWEELAGLLRLQRLVAPTIVVLVLTINLIALLFALAPAHHNRYLGKLLQVEPTLQHVYDNAPAEASFVAQQARIKYLDVLLNIPPGLRGPLIWRVVQPDTTGDLLTVIVQQPFPGSGSYRIDVSPYRFKAGQTYILKLEAPAITAQRPLLTIFSGDSATGNPSAADLGLQVVYPAVLKKQTLLRADYLLRSDSPGSLRGTIQRILYPLVVILFLLLAAVALAPLVSRPKLLAISLISLGLTLTVLWPTLRPTDLYLPTFRITALQDLRPEPHNDSTVFYGGVHDIADCNVISGWAWNANQPNSPINVDIYDGSAVVATVSANVFRLDLLNAGIGDGYHGFSYAIDDLLKNGKPHSIRVQFAATNTDLHATPKTITCSPVGPQAGTGVETPAPAR